jgi:hypothetical protein
LLCLMRESVGHRLIPSIIIYQTVSEGRFSETHLQAGASLYVRTGAKRCLGPVMHETLPQDVVGPHKVADFPLPLALQVPYAVHTQYRRS